MPTRLILLDIDDCISSDRSILACTDFDETTVPGYLVPRIGDRVGIGLVNRVCSVCAAKIVIISSWIAVAGPAYTMRWLAVNGLLAEHLWKPDPCVNYGPGSSKIAAIDDWHIQNPTIPVEEIVVVDDDETLFPAAHPLASRQVVIDGENGILLRHYRTIVGLFGATDRLSGRPHPAPLDE